MGDYSAPAPAGAVDSLDVLTILARRKKLLFGLPLAVALCAALASFALPAMYRANTRLMPPQQAQSGAAALMAQLGGVAGAAAGAAGIKSSNDLYLGMLKSRTVADRLIARFNLKKVYGLEYAEQVRKELDGNTTLSSGRDNLISIEVEDSDRARAAALANGYAEELLNLSRVLAVTEASQRRLFFERQLQLSKDNLAQAETTLKGALDTHGVVSVDSQSRAMVETVARLRAQIAGKEIERNAMQAFVTPQNQDYKRASQELASMRGELARQENGGASAPAPAQARGGLDNIKILRDVKYHQMLYEMLAKQYEIARLDEAKDAAIIQVLDAAQAPERKSRPRRAIITIMAGFVAFCLTALWVLSGGLLALTGSDPVRARKVDALRAALRMRGS